MPKTSTVSEVSATNTDLPILSPQTCKGDFKQAYDLACDHGEPVFCPVSIYADDRGWSMMNLLTEVLQPEGQINYSATYPGVVKAWHRHQRQTDFWLCLMGNIKVGVHRETDGQSWQLIMGEKRPGVLIIPPTLWHGMATVGPQTAGLMYYVTKAYDPQAPDEERRSFDSIKGFPWGVQHR